MEWKIYYDDGSTFSDLDGKPEDAPARGVEVILFHDIDGFNRIVRFRDYYVFKADQWYAVDLFGLWDYLASAGYKIVKFGRTIATAEFQKILHNASNDPDLPMKAGKPEYEVRR